MHNLEETGSGHCKQGAYPRPVEQSLELRGEKAEYNIASHGLYGFCHKTYNFLRPGKLFRYTAVYYSRYNEKEYQYREYIFKKIRTYKSAGLYILLPHDDPQRPPDRAADHSYDKDCKGNSQPISWLLFQEVPPRLPLFF